jgi:hypothetical protein
MSVISMLVIKAAQPPSLDELRKEARQGGDPIDFVQDVDLNAHDGYLPVRAYGRDTGFEFYFEPISEGEVPDDALRYGGHTIMTRTGGDFEEARAAFLFLKVAARLTNGACVFPDDETVVAPDQVDAYLAAQIEECNRFIK